MRTNIYYWKCDNPLPVEEKLVYNDKYRLADISDMVRAVARFHFNDEPMRVEPSGVSGNHYAYVITYPDREVFFRSDDGKIDDDYMDAEEAAMNLAGNSNVPVPQVFVTDTTKKLSPVRYQLMGNVSGENMKNFFQDGTLDKIGVSRDVGRYLANLHSIELDGFGFFNTEILKKEGRITGLNRTNREYFDTKLEDHLRYLRDTQFLTREEEHDIERLIGAFGAHLNIPRGRMVHKDIAFWNMVGTPTRVNAIVDWDDVISGDPIDDLAVMRCFYNEDIFIPLLEGYREVTPLPDDFYPRLWLYVIRNMLWKAVFRSFMKYFELDAKSAILNQDKKSTLKEFTHNQLSLAVNELKKM
jgi:aminoglycoside phosphotransferase (APT) family kinase protein